MRKFLSVLLAVIMALSLFSFAALATEIDAVQLKYDSVYYSAGSEVIQVKQNGKWGFVDMTGREIAPCKYDGMSDGGEGLVRVAQKVNGKWLYGFIDETGKEIASCKYIKTFDFSDGLAAVENEAGKHGYIDKTGKEVIPLKYDGAGPFSGGIARVFLGELGSGSNDVKFGCIDSAGDAIVPLGKYDAIGIPSNGVVDVWIEGQRKGGFVDNTGKEIIPCQYDDMLFFHEKAFYNEIAWVWRGDESLAINKAGQEIVSQNKYQSSDDEPSEGLLGVAVLCWEGDVGYFKWGFVECQTGKEVITCKYDEVQPFSDGYAGVCLNGMWGFVDKAGKEIVQCKYDYVYSFENGYAEVRKDNKLGIIDKTGKEIIPCISSSGIYFNGQVASIHMDGEQYLVGRNGEKIDVEIECDAIFANAKSIIVHSGGWGTVNEFGKVVIPCKYDYIDDVFGYVEVGLDGRKGLFDSKGNEIIPVKYDDVKVFTETLAAVKLGDKWGFVSLNNGRTAYSSTQTVSVDGKAVTFECYALRDASGNDTNYIKLRDMATILNGTAAQFNVNYDGSIVIETKKPYTTANGTEMNTPFSGDRDYKENTDVTKIDGVASDLAAITLTDDNGGGYTYYKLRDLGKALGFNVGWDSVKGNIFIETNKQYDPND